MSEKVFQLPAKNIANDKSTRQLDLFTDGREKVVIVVPMLNMREVEFLHLIKQKENLFCLDVRKFPYFYGNFEKRSVIKDYLVRHNNLYLRFMNNNNETIDKVDRWEIVKQVSGMIEYIGSRLDEYNYLLILVNSVLEARRMVEIFDSVIVNKGKNWRTFNIEP